MIEAALYFALGALSVSLLLFVILPIVSGRARRLAIHELERQAPVSLSEITAQKDQMRARFAVELNRQEKRADQLQVESQQHHVNAEKWRIFAERVEQEFEKLKDDYASLKKKLGSAEVNLEKQKEIAKSALKTMTGQEKKRLFELEDEVEELRSDKSAAGVRFVSMQTELNSAQSRIVEMERHMPSLEELNLRKELKALAEDVSDFVKSSPPPIPEPLPAVAPETVEPPIYTEQDVIAEQQVVVEQEISHEPQIPVEPQVAAATPIHAEADIVVEPEVSVQVPASIQPLNPVETPAAAPVELNQPVEVEAPAQISALAPEDPIEIPVAPPAQPAAEELHEVSEAVVTEIPAFLKTSKERQLSVPLPTDAIQEIADDAIAEEIPVEEAPVSETPADLRIAEFEQPSSLIADMESEIEAPTPMEAEIPAVEPTSPPILDTPEAGIPDQIVSASEEPAETSIVTMPVNGKEVEITGSKQVESAAQTKGKSAERTTNTAIVSVKRVKQGKLTRTKKSGFAGMIAAVSRSNKGTNSSGSSGKIKSGPVQYNGKMSLKNGTVRPMGTDASDPDAATPEKFGLEQTDKLVNDGSSGVKKPRKIIKFGKKTRRIKAAASS